ncbi:MAG: ASCH domain-containing protein [Rhodospirillales bacterium]|jgi:uncharacterized protein YhfF|nr:ASCH domain-containing protein [Rhodospirillales bacterium]MBT4040681.1 ASCH domain-containing protein [Rhodospirillales bacterium]MBT4626302.1 ASCH domain-containing protein [Rhodospirillales bacterium]MBT5353031.1 ASCH domain-containing protein [Rhodospirillales bacterium]MBT5520508.1 ASCH domain-containing protein [Rhodospirillales bacterium]
MIFHDSPEITAFWKDACTAINIDEESRHYALPFAECDEADEAVVKRINAIGELAAKNLKRGTCHQEIQFELDDVPMRRVGDYWIVVRLDGTPVCVVKIIGINIVPFNQVGPEFAASEGPERGLLPSHENWSFGHRRYFMGQCERWGVPWHEDNPVVCESFITVYSPASPLGVRD